MASESLDVGFEQFPFMYGFGGPAKCSGIGWGRKFTDEIQIWRKIVFSDAVYVQHSM